MIAENNYFHITIANKIFILIANVSIGELVREAVSVYYGIRTTEDKSEALNKLESMRLPIGSPELIEQQILNGQDLERFGSSHFYLL